MAISTKKRLAISMAALCLCACSQESAHALVATSALTTTGIAELVAPNVLSLTHRDRLLDGELYASSTRLDWRTLLKRTFDIDLRICVRCGGRLNVRAVVTAPASLELRTPTDPATPPLHGPSPTFSPTTPYWGPVRTRCRPATKAHDESHTFYQQGFRCCADAPKKRAAPPPARSVLLPIRSFFVSVGTTDLRRVDTVML